MRRFLLALLTAAAACAHAEDKPRPLMRHFMGLCGHTVQFQPVPIPGVGVAVEAGGIARLPLAGRAVKAVGPISG